jgi:hypothetical protein
MAELSMTVATQVELEVGEKTAAWLVSLGWTPPAVKVEDAEPHVEPRVPSAGLEAARQAFTARQAGLYQAQQIREALKTEVSSPERIDQMLNLAGVPLRKMDAFSATPDA